MTRNMIRTTVICLFIAVLSLFSSPAFSKGNDSLEIVVGQSKVVKTDFEIKKIAIGNPDICGVTKLNSTELLVNAKKIGKTNILIWGKKNNKREISININSIDVINQANELRSLMKDIDGVAIEIVGQKVVVKGEVFTGENFTKVNRMLVSMPEVLNLLEISPMVKEILREEIEKAVGMETVTVKAGKNKFILQGQVASDAAALRAEKVALAYSPDIVNTIVVVSSMAKVELIEMTLNIMAVSKSALKDFGINWNPQGEMGAESGLQFGSDGVSFSGGLTGSVSNLLQKVKKIKELGKGRVLKQQSVVTKSGGTANFFAGSEIPIPVAQEGGAMSVEYKKVGLTFNISPTIDVYNNVDTFIHIESSSIAGEGLGGAPILDTHQLDTVINVPSNTSIALGGLIGQRELKTLSQAPESGSGSSLAQSNKGERLIMEQFEVIIFVTPRILTSAKEAIKGLGGRVEDRFKEYERESLRDEMKRKQEEKENKNMKDEDED